MLATRQVTVYQFAAPLLLYSALRRIHLMSDRRHPKLVAGRATRAEHALVVAAAAANRQTMNDFVREAVLLAARSRLAVTVGPATGDAHRD